MPVDKTIVRPTQLYALRQYPVNGKAVKNLALAAYSWLEANKQTVNALNVFPVPDGDTGTNMSLTMKSAVDEIKELPEDKADEVLNALAQGALMGARGNSGVILSQIWRGFARSVQGKTSLSSQDLAAAFAAARDTAYKGVVRPVEGTILTVAKDMAAAAQEGADKDEDPITMLARVLQASKDSVQRTPELLPILREAGVVDSGGKGLSLLLEGMLRWVEGNQLHTAESIAQPINALNFENTMEAVEEGQDFEVVVDFRPSKDLDLKQFYGDLEKMGTSIQVGEGDGMYRMHIHVPTEKLYDPIEYTRELGTVTNVAIENLMAQMDAIGAKAGAATFKLANVDPGQVAVVAVAPGKGLRAPLRRTWRSRHRGRRANHESQHRRPAVFIRKSAHRQNNYSAQQQEHHLGCPSSRRGDRQTGHRGFQPLGARRPGCHSAPQSLRRVGSRGEGYGISSSRGADRGDHHGQP